MKNRHVADELKRLESLLQHGTLSRNEFEKAQHHVLQDAVRRQSSRPLDEAKVQDRVDQLDRQWQRDRQSFTVHGQHGDHLPGQAGSALRGMVVVVVGIIWTALIASMSGPGIALFTLFGVAFIIVGAIDSLVSFVKAGEYEGALERYQSRRAALLKSRAALLRRNQVAA